jgi:hypothetical protein
VEQVIGIKFNLPVFGERKLRQTQINDNLKITACANNSIDYYVIDTSAQKYVKERTSKKYLDFITEIINIKKEQ